MESEDHPLIPQSRKRRTWSVIAWATVWLLALTACGTGDPPQGTVGFIVIEPGAVLLTAAGETVQLRATVFDGAGNPVDLPVTWHSVTPTVVTVDGEGLATAATGLGSAQVVARTDSLESAPLLLVVAPTVAGAILVSDEQVVDGPVAVDDLADYGPGWRYAVTLVGVPALVPGDLMVGTGATPLGGRVVAVVDVSGGVRVTLEIVGLDELFTALEIDETLDLLHARPEFDDEVLAAYDITHHPDGSIVFAPRSPAAASARPAQVTGVRALGVFDCSTTTTFPFSLPKAPQFTITPTVKMQLDYSLAAGLRKLGAEGAVKAEFKFEPKVSASFEGKLECEVELMAFPIPVGGPIALVIGGQVPIGVGFELKGKLVVAELGLEVNATGTATFGMGVACPQGDCEPYATGNLTVDPKVTLRLPNVDEQLRLTFSVEPFAFADLALGARSFKRLRIQLLRFTLGASQKFDLATASGQVADPAYASTFDLRALLKAKLGRDVTRALALLKVTIKPLELTLVDSELAASPRGTFTIEPATVAPTTAEGAGDLATFTVTLSPTTYLGLEVIDRVEFRWQRDGALSEGRPACSVLAASPGQSTFSCTTDFLEEHEGLQTFYAFVHVKLFGVPLAIPLEINKDARATVEVSLCQPTSSTLSALRPTSDHEQCAVPANIGLQAGYNHTALLLSDGTLYAWGWNNGGGPELFLSSPTLVPRFGAEGTTITTIAAGSVHLAALLSDGALYAWGANRYGGLGDGTFENRATPTRVPDFPPGGTSITSLAAGSLYSAALLDDGSLYTWGNNRNGQLGIGTWETVPTPTIVANFPPLGTTITKIAAGFQHAALLLNDGSLYTWGLNYEGQLGDGTTTSRNTPTPVPSFAPQGTTITDIAAGGYYTLARLSNGDLYTWGFTGEGEQGDGFTATPTLVPNFPPQGATITAMAAGGFHTAVLLSDGRLYTWGENDVGQLGDGTTKKRNTPELVPSFAPQGTTITTIAAGTDHTAALLSDGSLYTWGYNEAGQLGIGTTDNALTPTRVPGFPLRPPP